VHSDPLLFVLSNSSNMCTNYDDAGSATVNHCRERRVL
jgi:hypothetical protein